MRMMLLMPISRERFASLVGSIPGQAQDMDMRWTGGMAGALQTLHQMHPCWVVVYNQTRLLSQLLDAMGKHFGHLGHRFRVTLICFEAELEAAKGVFSPLLERMGYSNEAPERFNAILQDVFMRRKWWQRIGHIISYWLRNRFNGLRSVGRILSQVPNPGRLCDERATS